MEIEWNSKKDKKRVLEMAKKNRHIAIRMERISASYNFTDIEHPQNGRAHFLKGNYKGCFSVDIEKKTCPIRLICKPIGNYEKDGSGSYIKETITKIRIIKIEKNYHKK